MKIKLIAPARKPEWGESFWDLKTLCKFTGRKAGGAPLALPTLAALTPSDVEVVLTDENVETIDFDEKVDLIGITGMTCVIPRSYEIADEYRRRGIPVIMGGIHVSMLPEEAIQHCDAVVVGEAEEIWAQVVRDAQKKNLQKFYRAPRFPDLSNSPIPRWDLLKNDKYCYFTIQTGRGCPYDCEFCSVKVFNGREYRHKTIEQVVKEVEILLKLDFRKLIFFSDDNLLAVPSYAEELCNELSRLTIKNWMCQASLNRLRDENLLQRMRQGGCRVVFVGIESVSQSSLHAMNKHQVNNVNEYKDIIHKVHNQGISIFGSFIFGSDNDTERIFEDTITFINENRIAFAMVNIMTLLPGTKLYERLKSEKRAEDFPWWKTNADWVCFQPKRMSRMVLEEGHERVLKEIYGYRNQYNRLQALWDKNIFTRDKKYRYSMTRIFFTLYAFLCLNFSKARFLIKSLWYAKKTTSILWILTALNYNSYVRSFKRERNV